MEDENEIVANITEKQEFYGEVIDEIIEELKCSDCTELSCRFCRLVAPNAFREDIDKLCSLNK